MKELIVNGGTPGVLAAIVVMLGLHLLARLGEFLWKVKEKRDAITESGLDRLSTAVQQNTYAAQKLETRINALEHTISDISKFKLDLRRLYAAVKHLSGDQWSTIRKEIMDEETTQ